MTPAPPTRNQLLVDIKQASRLLGGLSRSTLYEHLKAGSLPSISIGRRRFVRLTDLEAFVDRFQNQQLADRIDN